MDSPLHAPSPSTWEHESLLSSPPTTKEASAPSPLPTSNAHRPPSPIRRLTPYLLTTLITALLTALLTLTLHPSAQPPLPPLLPTGTDPTSGHPLSWFSGPCGPTATNARAQNCHFDTLSFAWLPPACALPADAIDEADFHARGPWPWWDENGTALAEADVFAGEARFVFTSLDWHMAHCTYLWRRLHRQVRDGRRVDGYVADLRHTEHCGEMLRMGEEERRGARTRVWVKFPGCG